MEKYTHEIQLIGYTTDILKVIADVLNGKSFPRYYDLVDQVQAKKQKPIDYDVDDVIDMFKGKGKLAERGYKS